MNPAHLAGHILNVSDMCREAEPTTWTADERDDVLRGLSTISYEVVGLSARIRAAKVNDTKPVHPVKPLNPKPPTKPVDPEPEPDPPPDPPNDRSAS